MLSEIYLSTINSKNISLFVIDDTMSCLSMIYVIIQSIAFTGEFKATKVEKKTVGLLKDPKMELDLKGQRELLLERRLKYLTKGLRCPCNRLSCLCRCLMNSFFYKHPGVIIHLEIHLWLFYGNLSSICWLLERHFYSHNYTIRRRNLLEG